MASLEYYDNNSLLASIPATYNYTASAPRRATNQTKSVLETAKRSIEYGKFKGMETYEPSCGIERIDIKEINAEVDLELTAALSYDWVEKKQLKSGLIKAFEDLERWLLRTPASDLANGRKTYCPTCMKNEPAPQAFRHYTDVLTDNLGYEIGNTFHHYVSATVDLIARDPESMIKIRFMRFNKDMKEELVNSYKTMIDEHFGGEEMDDDFGFSAGIDETFPDFDLEMKYTIDPKNKKRIWKMDKEAAYSYGIRTIKHKDWLKRLSILATFNKQGEQGQLNARAISTGTMALRLFLTIIEHLGAEIATAGGLDMFKSGKVDKSASIRDLKGEYSNNYIIGITGDKTKWNECISIPSICTMYYQFAHITYDNRGVNDPRKIINNSMRLARLQGMFSVLTNLFINKEVIVGPGISCFLPEMKKACETFKLEEIYGSKDWINPEVSVLTDWAEPYFNFEYNTVGYPIGMQMGMANISSTIVCEMYRFKEVSKRQASDDYIGVIGIELEKRPTIVERYRLFEKCMNKYRVAALMDRAGGFNDSVDKCFAIEGAEIIEYNSLIVTDTFVGNVGPNIPSLNILGQNPIVDYESLRQSQVTMAYEGALEPILLTISMAVTDLIYRLAWHTNSKSERRNARGFILDAMNTEVESRGKKTLIYSGGANPHSISTLNLNTIAVALSLCKDIDLDYLKRLVNPNSATNFANDSSNKMILDHGKTLMFDETQTLGPLRTMWATNRTCITSTQGRLNARSTDEIGKGVRVAKIISPELFTCETREKFPIGEQLCIQLKLKVQRMDHLSEADKEKWLNEDWPLLLKSLERHKVRIDDMKRRELY